MSWPILGMKAHRALENLRETWHGYPHGMRGFPYCSPRAEWVEDRSEVFYVATKRALERVGYAKTVGSRVEITEAGLDYLDAVEAGDAPAPVDETPGSVLSSGSTAYRLRGKVALNPRH